MSNKRDHIMRATRDLVYEQGLQDVSVAQIAQRAEVGMGTIYNYFASKEELVFRLYSQIKAASSAYVLEEYDEDQPVVRRFLHVLTSIAYYGIQHPRDFILMQQLAEVPYIQTQAKSDQYPITAVAQRLFTDAKNQHLLKELPDEVLNVLLFGALYALVEAHIAQEIQLNDILIQQAVSACWDTIKR